MPKQVITLSLKPVAVGDVIKGNATVLAVKPAPQHNTSKASAVIVLCIWRNEFVSWVADEDGEGTVWGHYSDDLASALREFEAR